MTRYCQRSEQLKERASIDSYCAFCYVVATFHSGRKSLSEAVAMRSISIPELWSAPTAKDAPATLQTDDAGWVSIHVTVPLPDGASHDLTMTLRDTFGDMIRSAIEGGIAEDQELAWRYAREITNLLHLASLTVLKLAGVAVKGGPNRASAYTSQLSSSTLLLVQEFASK